MAIVYIFSHFLELLIKRISNFVYYEIEIAIIINHFLLFGFL